MICTADHCETPTADGIHLCEIHEKELWDLLGRIPETLADARDTVARLDARRDVGRSGSTPGTPVNLEASERVTALHELLVSWSRMLHEQTGAEGNAGAEYLRAHLRAIVGSDWAGDCLDELSRAHRRVVACVDVPPDKLDLGECGVEGCSGRIVGSLVPNPKWEPGGRAPERVPNSRAQCRACHVPYDGKEVYAFQVARTHGELRTVRETVRLIEGIPGAPSRSTLQRWITRGWVQVHNRDGVEMIEPAQVVALIEREAA